jgi:hypothetical protein
MLIGTIGASVTASAVSLHPLICVPSAIPASERAAHFALAHDIFQGQALSTSELPNGWAVRFDDSSYEAVVRFISNERKCCPAIRFELDVAAASAGLHLRMTGPEGAREFLAAELPLHVERAAGTCNTSTCHA